MRRYLNMSKQTFNVIIIIKSNGISHLLKEIKMVVYLILILFIPFILINIKYFLYYFVTIKYYNILINYILSKNEFDKHSRSDDLLNYGLLIRGSGSVNFGLETNISNYIIDNKNIIYNNKYPFLSYIMKQDNDFFSIKTLPILINRNILNIFDFYFYLDLFYIDTLIYNPIEKRIIINDDHILFEKGQSSKLQSFLNKIEIINLLDKFYNLCNELPQKNTIYIINY